MSLKFPSGGHHWRRLSPGNPVGVDIWKRYLDNYVRPYGLNSDKHPARYYCKTCKIAVPVSGPSESDALCANVCAEHIHNC